MLNFQENYVVYYEGKHPLGIRNQQEIRLNMQMKPAELFSEGNCFLFRFWKDSNSARVSKRKWCRLTARNVEKVSISDSHFITIPWPGIHVFNSSRVSIKQNTFKQVAPRSLVFKHGQYLEVSHNALQVASALDVSQFPRLAIYCNHPRKPLQCTRGQDGKSQYDLDNQSVAFIYSLASVLYGHFWILLVFVAISMVSNRGMKITFVCCILCAYTIGSCLQVFPWCEWAGWSSHASLSFLFITKIGHQRSQETQFSTFVSQHKRLGLQTPVVNSIIILSADPKTLVNSSSRKMQMMIFPWLHVFKGNVFCIWLWMHFYKRLIDCYTFPRCLRPTKESFETDKDLEDDEYSNSSRLHLAGGSGNGEHSSPKAVVVPGPAYYNRKFLCSKSWPM